MEALSGASAALLCIYDLTKGIFPALEISDLHLIRKEGGKSGVWIHPKSIHESPARPQAIDSLAWSEVHFSVITLSDRCSKKLAEDLSGPKITERAKKWGATFDQSFLIPDDEKLLKTSIREIQGANPHPHLVLCTGGTGLGPRDLTPETILAMGGKIVPGIGELIRQKGSAHTPYSWLSRAEGFLLNQSLIVCLPGSAKAVTESLDAIVEIIPHALQMVRGDHHR